MSTRTYVIVCGVMTLGAFMVGYAVNGMTGALMLAGFALIFAGRNYANRE